MGPAGRIQKQLENGEEMEEVWSPLEPLRIPTVPNASLQGLQQVERSRSWKSDCFFLFCFFFAVLFFEQF